MEFVNPYNHNLQAYKAAIRQAVHSARLDATDGELAEIFKVSEMAYTASLFWAQNAGAVKWKLIDPMGEVVSLPKPNEPVTRKLSLHEESMVKFLSNPALGRCLYNFEMSYRFFGRALGYRLRNDYGILKSVQYINPLYYQPVINPATGQLLEFRVYQRMGNLPQIYQISPQDALYYYGFSFETLFDGVSSAEVAFYHAFAGSDLAIMARSIFQNMAIPALAIQPKDPQAAAIGQDDVMDENGEITDKGDPTRFSEFLNQRVKGSMNAGATIVTHDAYEYITLSNPALRDMDTGTQRENINRAISMAFQVNDEFFTPGLTTYAELGGKIRLWQEMQFLPHMRDYAQTISEQIIMPLLPGYTAAIDETNLLYESQDEKQKVIDFKLKSGLVDLYTASQQSGTLNPPEWQKELYYADGFGYVPASVIPTLYQSRLGYAAPPDTSTPQVSVSAPPVDNPVIDAPTQTPQITPRSVKSSSHVPTHVQDEIEILNRKAGKGSSFIPDNLPIPVVLRAYHLVEAGLDEEQRFKALKAYYLKCTDVRMDGFKSIQSTRLDYEGQVEDLLTDAVKGNVDRRRFTLRMNQLIKGYGEQAFRDGLKDGGVQGEDLDENDTQRVDDLITQQRQYIIGLADAIYKDERVTQQEVANKATMWFNKTIYPFYTAGVASAATNGVFEWVLGKAEDHCTSCQVLAGQRRRFSFWKARVLPKDSRLKCRGYLCTCSMVLTKQASSRGKLPNWQAFGVKSEEHDHDHDHEPIIIQSYTYAIKALTENDLDWFAPSHKQVEISITAEVAA